MPAYNFLKSLAPLVASGEKPLTIRTRRKRPTVAGDKLYLYTGMRNKSVCKLKETVVHEEFRIMIFETRVLLKYKTNGPFKVWKILTKQQTQRLAILDGFGSVEDFYAIHQKLGNIRHKELQLIYWGRIPLYEVLNP